MPGICVLGIDCDKNTSASEENVPWTLCIISCFTSRTVLMSLHAVVLFTIWGVAISSVNFVMGSWHP